MIRFHPLKRVVISAHTITSVINTKPTWMWIPHMKCFHKWHWRCYPFSNYPQLPFSHGRCTISINSTEYSDSNKALPRKQFPFGSALIIMSQKKLVATVKSGYSQQQSDNDSFELRWIVWELVTAFAWMIVRIQYWRNSSKKSHTHFNCSL